MWGFLVSTNLTLSCYSLHGVYVRFSSNIFFTERIVRKPVCDFTDVGTLREVRGVFEAVRNVLLCSERQNSE